MSLLYVLVRIVLTFIQYGLYFQTWKWQKRYEARAKEVKSLASDIVHSSLLLTPNDIHDLKVSDRTKLCDLVARRCVSQDRLSKITPRRDQAEDKWMRWDTCSESLMGWRNWMAQFNGRTVPYLLGKVDTLVTCVILEYYSCGPITLLTTLTGMLPW